MKVNAAKPFIKQCVVVWGVRGLPGAGWERKKAHRSGLRVEILPAIY